MATLVLEGQKLNSLGWRMINLVFSNIARETIISVRHVRHSPTSLVLVRMQRLWALRVPGLLGGPSDWLSAFTHCPPQSSHREVA